MKRNGPAGGTAIRRRSGLACVAAGFALATACSTPEPVDLLLHSGVVLALEEAGTTGTALVIREGKVVAVGGDELRDRYAAEREVDLAGRTAMPGFNDAHIHIRGGRGVTSRWPASRPSRSSRIW